MKQKLLLISSSLLSFFLFLTILTMIITFTIKRWVENSTLRVDGDTYYYFPWLGFILLLAILTTLLFSSVYQLIKSKKL